MMTVTQASKNKTINISNVNKKVNASALNSMIDKKTFENKKLQKTLLMLSKI